MIIIGITGTLGAGKGTIVDYLVREKGYGHFSVRAYLLEEIKKQNLPPTRDSMVAVANKFRKDNSPSFIIDQLYIKARTEGKSAIIESIRTPGEVISLQQKGIFYLFAVDADPKIRYERIQQRKSETDHVTFETFIANEKREMTSNDPNKQNLIKCIDMADYVFENDGSLQNLYHQVEYALSIIEKNEK